MIDLTKYKLTKGQKEFLEEFGGLLPLIEDLQKALKSKKKLGSKKLPKGGSLSELIRKNKPEQPEHCKRWLKMAKNSKFMYPRPPDCKFFGYGLSFPESIAYSSNKGGCIADKGSKLDKLLV